MENKFSYYDFIAHLIPGILCIYGLLTSNNFLDIDLIIDSLSGTMIFITLAYIIGHILHFLSKYTIELFVKKVFWKGRWFSEVFLIKEYKYIENIEPFIDIAEIRYSIDTSILREEFNSEKAEELYEISQHIFKTFCSFVQNKGYSSKADSHNNMYGFFRCICFTFILLSIIAFLSFFILQFHLYYLYFSISCFAAALIFFIRTRERGEKFVKEIYYSALAANRSVEA